MPKDDHLFEYSELIFNDGGIDDLIKDLKRLEKEAISTAANIKKAFIKTKPFDVKNIEKLEQGVKEVTIAQKNATQALKAANKVRKKTIELTDEQLIQVQAEKRTQRERIQRAKQLAIITKEEKNNIASLRAQLSLATLDWSKLTEAETTNTAAGRKLVKTKLDLTNQLKKLEKRTGDNRREVGNYGKALKRLDRVGKTVRKGLIRLFVGRTIIDGVARLGNALVGLVDDFRGTNSAIDGVGKSFDKIGNTLQFVGVKLLEALAPAIEKVANFLAKLPAIFAGASAAGTQFVNILSAGFNKLSLNVELAFAKIDEANPFSGKNPQDIINNIDRINRAIGAQSARQGSIVKAYKDAYDAVIKEQEAFVKKQEETARSAQRKQLAAELKAIQAAEQKKIEIRLKAIIQLQLLLQNVEIANIKDREERLLALEEQRFAAEQQLAISRFEELQKLFEESEQDTTEIKATNDKLKEEQEVQHQRNLASIRKEFTDAQRQEAKDNLRQIREDRIEEEERFADAQEESRDARKEQLRDIRDAREEQEAKDLEAIKKKEDANKKLIEEISEASKKVGALIGELFQKQADLAGEQVAEQETNLSNAEARQREGLETNLAFEREQLAKRQAEQQAKQKEAETAAKILTLFNLVAAYAQGGDENALFSGLRDFAFLTAISAGFEEGGYTGDQGTKAVAGFVHGQEFVVKAAETAKYGLVGKSGDEFGSAMGDYFHTETPMSTNPIPAQKEAFERAVVPQQNSDTGVIAAVNSLSKQIADQPNYSAQIVQVQADLWEMVLEKDKQNMKKIERKILRAKN